VIALLLLVALLPRQVLIATSRGQTSVPVTTERGAAAVAAPLLAQPLGLSASREGSTARVVVGGRAFEFDLGAPFVRAEGAAYPLVGAPYVVRDTLFLPLHWLVEYVPRLLAGRYRWDPGLARLEETRAIAVTTPPPAVLPPPLPFRTRAAPTIAPASGGVPHPATGLRQPHTIVVDPGHGGVDPGNPGLHFPGRLTEKDITLAIGRLVRGELTRRGLTVVLTRSTDTLVDLEDRPRFCRADCDLFVSIHVNAMPVGRRQSQVSGIETYFLSDAKTEDQKRVAEMENDALRFETERPVDGGPLAFILRDLQLNEYLRESAQLAQLIQERVAGIHPGENRGVQQGPFLVLAAARRPAVLLEVGFATHRADASFLASASGQREIARAIADGIIGYLRDFERKLAVGGGGGEP